MWLYIGRRSCRRPRRKGFGERTRPGRFLRCWRRGRWHDAARSGWSGRKKIAQSVGCSPAIDRRRGRDTPWFKKGLYAVYQFLWLKRFSNQLVRFHRNGFVGDAFVHYSRHEQHRSRAETGILLDLAANGVTVLIGHDDVGDHDVGAGLFELRDRGGRVGTSNHMDVFAAESNLNHFAHGGAVVNEINGWDALLRRFIQGREHHGFVYRASLFAMSRESSSTSRMASSIKSVAERSTVRCGEVVPYTNL